MKHLVLIPLLLGLAFGSGCAGTPTEQNDTAHPEFDAVARQRLDAQLARALFTEAELKREQGDAYGAQELFRELLAQHQNFEDLSVAIDRLYDLGLGFLAGQHSWPFLVFDFDSPRTGIEIVEFLINRFEQNRFDFARYQIAEHFFGEENFDDAVKHYTLLIEEYPGSLWQPTARFKRAICFQRLWRGYNYDASQVEQAEIELQEYLRRYPSGNHVVEAETALSEIRGDRAHLHYDNAWYYFRREHSSRAALVYIEAILRDAPESEWAAATPDLLEAIVERETDGGNLDDAARAQGLLARLDRAAGATPDAASAGGRPE
ncbi:MAG: tetratricopeptide repeat protein [Planctomycetota bacterium]